MLQLWLVNLLHGEWRVPTKFILGCKTYKPNLDFLKKGSLLSTHVLNLMPKNHVVFHIIKKKKKADRIFLVTLTSSECLYSVGLSLLCKVWALNKVWFVFGGGDIAALREEKRST